MNKKILAMIIAAAMVFSLTPMTAFAANSLNALKLLVPAGAIEIKAEGASINNHSGPDTLWWYYDSITKTGDVYLLMANSQAGKIAASANLGGKSGKILDTYRPGGNGTAYSLIKFENVWLSGNVLLTVDMNGGGHNINNVAISAYFSLVTLNYYNGDDFLASDNELSGNYITVKDVDELPDAKKGYEFLGWSYAKGATQAEVFAGDEILMGNKDIDLYAVWGEDASQIYTIKYVAGTGGSVSNESEKHQVLYTGANEGSTATADKGYKFVNWTDASGKVASASAAFVPSENADATFYANFEIDPDQTYTIKYVAGAGGSVSKESEEHQVLYTGANEGSTAAADIGYKFVNWTDASGKVASTDAAFVPSENADATFYANFEIDLSQTKKLSYTIEYYLDGVYEESDAVSEFVWVNDSDMLTVQPIDTNKYLPVYDFDFTDPASLPATIKDGGVIKAYYKKVIFTVTFEPGTQGAFDEVTHGGLYYGVATPEAPVTLAKPGWQFASWAPALAATVTADVTYTAQWEQIPYTVTFDFGGKGGDIDANDIDGNYTSKVVLGNGSNEGQIIYDPVHFGDKLPKAPHPYAEFGYKFVGWYWVEGGQLFEPDHYTNPSSVYGKLPETVGEGDMTFVAKWAVVNPDQVFPDKIPSVSHVDKWWGDYGILCYAASNGDTPYFVSFAPWFYEVYRTVGIGFGTSGDWQYAAVFTADGATWAKGNSGAMLGSDLSNVPFSFTAPAGGKDSYAIHKNVTFDAKYTSGGQGNINFGNLLGIWFDDPFVSGAKQAWVGTPSDFSAGGNPGPTQPQPQPQPKTYSNLSNKGKAGSSFTHGAYAASESKEMNVSVTSLDKNMSIEIVIYEDGQAKASKTVSANGGSLQFDASFGSQYSVMVKILSANGNSSYTISVSMP